MVGYILGIQSYRKRIGSAAADLSPHCSLNFQVDASSLLNGRIRTQAGVILLEVGAFPELFVVEPSAIIIPIAYSQHLLIGGLPATSTIIDGHQEIGIV